MGCSAPHASWGWPQHPPSPGSKGGQGSSGSHHTPSNHQMEIKQHLRGSGKTPQARERAQGTGLGQAYPRLLSSNGGSGHGWGPGEDAQGNEGIRGRDAHGSGVWWGALRARGCLGMCFPQHPTAQPSRAQGDRVHDGCCRVS